MAVANPWLVAGGALSLAAAAAAHLAVIAGGPAWYRAFGAGERMARMAEADWATPALLTLAIAAVLATFGAYALSGAGVIPRLPMLPWVLAAVTAIYLARGPVLVLPHAAWRPDLSPAFKFRSSAIVLAIGLVHLIGLWRGWTHLRGVA